MIEEGVKAPSFCLKDSTGSERCLDEFTGKWVVLYFYPKDNTSGCTLEAIEFSALEEEFRGLGAVVMGISPDTCESHAMFIGKHNLTVILLSDPEKKVLEPYGAWRMKKMYDKEPLGVVRSTVLISPDGKVAKTWDNVEAEGHAAKVLEALREISVA
ncbi:MAG TPA: peroxiredoxin [Synergistales bacterium]|mgnify:CR=1 FL=1|nr:peroxiredoxin [Synergistales bacterium]